VKKINVNNIIVMAIVYKKCVEDGNVPEYLCDPCVITEKGRVRGTAYIHKSLKDVLEGESSTPGIKNVELKAWWETQILAGLIKVIPKTRGTYDGGTSNMITGYGDVSEIKSNKTHTLVFSDPNHKGNDDFWQGMENVATDYLIAWRTETELRVANAPLDNIDAQDAVEEDINSDVRWQVTNTWRQNKPKMNVAIYNLGDVKDVFDCIDEEASNP